MDTTKHKWLCASQVSGLTEVSEAHSHFVGLLSLFFNLFIYSSSLQSPFWLLNHHILLCATFYKYIPANRTKIVYVGEMFDNWLTIVIVCVVC